MTNIIKQLIPNISNKMAFKEDSNLIMLLFYIS